MIKLRHEQPSLWHRGLAEDIEGLWERWMLVVDKRLEDEQLVDTIYEAQGERHPQSRIRGRMQTPAEAYQPPSVVCLNQAPSWPFPRLRDQHQHSQCGPNSSPFGHTSPSPNPW